MRAGFSIFSVLAMLSFALPASDWPQFRGAKGDGVSTETGINKDWKTKPPKELWRINLGDGGYAGPSVAAGKMFIIDRQGKEDVVRAVDLKTGKDVWTFKYPENYDSGNPQWGNGRSTPTFDDGKLYTFSASGMLHALDAEKGTKIWARDCKKDFGGRWAAEWWGYSPSPLVDGDKVVVCPGGPGAAMVALDKATGKDVWKGGGDDQAGYSTPVIATIEGKKQYVAFTGVSIIGVDAATGALLWRSVWTTSYNVNAASPVVIGDSVFVASGYGKGCGLIKIVGGKAEQAWTNKEIKAHFNSPVLVDGFLYGVGDPGSLVCLDPNTGTAAWKQTGFEKGGVVAVDGTLIAINGARNAGDVVMIKVDSKAYTELGRIKPIPDGGQSWTPPIVADGKLFVRSQKELVCLDLK